ncbi:30S ribosomal protein S3 [Luoshenia tenuis]|jgi:small subunit ribosomal protein S3|uniref:30S ribosomal protein S3 n=1 Tax=Luoshenia tenuis TaxID=2763654 RepID=UPI003D8DCE92
MGQKVNPHGFRVGVIKDWDARWFASKKDFADYLVEDEKIRNYLKEKLTAQGAAVSKIEIERAASKVTVNIFTARPGVVIGKGGAGVEAVKAETSALVGKPVNVNIIEVRNPDADAQLVAENIAASLEKRVSFRRAMKQAMGRAMKCGAKGIKIKCSGRLGGAEIARVEGYHDGSIPLQTLRADIQYGFAEAKTTYGRIGIKVWVYKGEILSKGIVPAAVANAKAAQQPRMGGNDRRRPQRAHEGGNK